MAGDTTGFDDKETTPLSRVEPESTPVADLHQPIYREMAEPKDGYEPPPTWLLFLCLALMGFGGWYLGMYSGGFSPQVYDERAGFEGQGSDAGVALAAVDPMVMGRRVYNNCMACHQKDGRGVTGSYPPLDGSEWVTGRSDVVAALVLHGLEGPIAIGGADFNEVMPARDHLTDEQIAAVLSHIRGSWSNAASAVSPELVSLVRERTKDRTQPWTTQELEGYRASFDPPEEQTVPDEGGAGAAT
jgi:mono/diheme cytochrome c family protein